MSRLFSGKNVRLQALLSYIAWLKQVGFSRIKSTCSSLINFVLTRRNSWAKNENAQQLAAAAETSLENKYFDHGDYFATHSVKLTIYA